MIKFNINLIKVIKLEILKKYKQNYTFKYKRQKHNITRIIKGILYILKTGIAWDNYIGKVKGKTLFFHYKRFVEANIFKTAYKLILNKYMSTNKQSKLKYQLFESVFIFASKYKNCPNLKNF